jgi:inhibitor of KinA
VSNFPKIKPFGDHCILLQWHQEISPEIHQCVMGAKRFFSEKYADAILEMVPAYNSLAVYLNAGISTENFIMEIETGLQSSPLLVSNKASLVYIPVCYGGDFGPDLEVLSEKLSISIDEIINIHTTPRYLTYFLGFLPGFPYLGGLDPRISFPRKATPRLQVNAGSVGIAGNQTGIYTTHSPGGWNIIGRCPLQFFDVLSEQPTLIQSGDYIKFYAISNREFDEIREKVVQSNYKIRKEELLV